MYQNFNKTLTFEIRLFQEFFVYLQSKRKKVKPFKTYIMTKELDLKKVEDLEFDGYRSFGGITHPDGLDDVFAVSGTYQDREMTDKELDILNDVYYEFVWEQAYAELCS